MNTLKATSASMYKLILKGINLEDNEQTHRDFNFHMPTDSKIYDSEEQYMHLQWPIESKNDPWE